MYSEFKSFSFMGVSNSEMFLSAEKDLNNLEINFLSRPTLEFQDDHQCEIAPLQLEEELHEKVGEDHKQHKEREEDKCKITVSSLKIQLPSLAEFKVEEDSDEGFKTPTSSDHKIPVVLQCPPAPRKPKSRPLTKRKVSPRRVLHDLSNEIEAMFPPALLADLGNKIKKVRKENNK